MERSERRGRSYTTVEVSSALAGCRIELIASPLTPEGLFSETCDERALPLVGSRSESVWKGGSRGGVAGGWNAACQSLVKWYIPGQIVQTAAPQALTEN